MPPGVDSIFVSTMCGNMTAKARHQRVAEFNAHDGPAVFVLMTRACGVGINLTAATRAIIPFPHYNPSHETQAAARIHRLGQTQPVEIFRIVCDGAYDHKVMVRANPLPIPPAFEPVAVQGFRGLFGVP